MLPLHDQSAPYKLHQNKPKNNAKQNQLCIWMSGLKSSLKSTTYIYWPLKNQQCKNDQWNQHQLKMSFILRQALHIRSSFKIKNVNAKQRTQLIQIHYWVNKGWLESLLMINISLLYWRVFLSKSHQQNHLCKNHANLSHQAEPKILVKNIGLWCLMIELFDRLSGTQHIVQINSIHCYDGILHVWELKVFHMQKA